MRILTIFSDFRSETHYKSGQEGKLGGLEQSDFSLHPLMVGDVVHERTIMVLEKNHFALIPRDLTML